MNVKFSDKAVLFKISESELQLLQSGSLMEMEMLLVGKKMLFRLKPNATTKILSIQFDLSPNKAAVELNVTQEALQQLADMGKNRDGLSNMQDGFQITLQVDTKTDSRPKKKGV